MAAHPKAELETRDNMAASLTSAALGRRSRRRMAVLSSQHLHSSTCHFYSLSLVFTTRMHRAHGNCIQRVTLLNTCLSMVVFPLALCAAPSRDPVCVSLAAWWRRRAILCSE